MKAPSRIFSFFALLFVTVAFKGDSCPALQFEGIYTYKIDSESSAVIRFYADKVVIVSSSINDYKQVMTWFNRDPENFSRVLTGKYKRSSKNCSLVFNVKGETGEQRYEGIIINDSLLSLNIFNPATKAKTTRQYKFVKP
ncbi:MAG: hypothetical protein ACRC3B_04635 [Bacteroidia bacterium]